MRVNFIAIMIWIGLVFGVIGVAHLLSAPVTAPVSTPSPVAAPPPPLPVTRPKVTVVPIQTQRPPHKPVVHTTMKPTPRPAGRPLDIRSICQQTQNQYHNEPLWKDHCLGQRR